MSEKDTLTKRDEEFLERIEQILAERDRETDGSLSFYAHLAKTAPQADEAFRQELEERLLTRLRQQRRDRIENAKPAPQAQDLHRSDLFRRPLRSLAALPTSRVAWGGIGLMIALLLLAAIPGLRTVVAGGVAELWRFVATSITVRPGEPITFQPAPPFTVFQPTYLPEGFERTQAAYDPPVDPETGRPRPGIRALPVPMAPGAEAPTLSPEPIDASTPDLEPWIALRYTDPDGRYLQLVQRPARPDRPLPAGEQRLVAGRPARLGTDHSPLKLTWVQEDTWIELEGTVSEEELLKVAEGLTVTQTPGAGAPDEAGPVAPLDRTKMMTELLFCDETQRPPTRIEPLLGHVPHQQQQGSVSIHLMDPDKYPYPDSLSWTSHMHDVPGDKVLERALAALRDPEASLQHLPYPSLGMFTVSADPEPCLKPNPAVRGYVVIEIWTAQVNIGYGGEGLELKEQAIQALEREIQKLR